MQIDVMGQLASVRTDLEEQNFFDLRGRAKKIIKKLLDEKKSPLAIEAWSFIPHPDVVAHISKVQRYIVAIDTQTSKVYAPVYEFLDGKQINVASYYTGGWADFICDIQLDHKQFERWLDELCK